MTFENNDEKDYKKHYSEDSFWDKLKKHAAKAGKKVVYTALLCYYAVQNPDIPMKAKATIYGALGYLILPIDLVPDLVPVVGYGDDLAALLFALSMVAVHINKTVRTQALNKMEDWFGPIQAEDQDIIDIEAQLVEVEKSVEEAAPTEDKR